MVFTLLTIHMKDAKKIKATMNIAWLRIGKEVTCYVHVKCELAENASLYNTQTTGWRKRLVSSLVIRNFQTVTVHTTKFNSC